MTQELQVIGNICVNTSHVKIASLAKILCHQFINGKRLALIVSVYYLSGLAQILKWSSYSVKFQEVLSDLEKEAWTYSCTFVAFLIILWMQPLSAFDWRCHLAQRRS